MLPSCASNHLGYALPHWLIERTPEAGTIKTNEARKVVLPHLIELSFHQWTQNQLPGEHLFLRRSASRDVLGPLQGHGGLRQPRHKEVSPSDIPAEEYHERS